ncbi:hypothetical protein ACJ72_04926 [Emergomyces africanus]|uniref:Iron-sulfur clusters transporter ATM1, mitochondrial n=1 Tax=Emergomyces africanus TaxID=1955775 RepID=A0A1B7NVF6_9EURO|nr:hypothetical protein ACJ72_04926 [Emergomyces africanus]
METLFNLQKVNISVKEKEDAKPLQLTRGGEIRFENVTFGYHPGRAVLKGVSFTIPPGQKFAIVGPSGCGKSTILRLLFRFYDVQGGRILVDGQDIHATAEEVRSAARRAQIHDLIERLPAGYETPVGERGMMISGGEKQRLAVARLILKDPPLFIFR